MPAPITPAATPAIATGAGLQEPKTPRSGAGRSATPFAPRPGTVLRGTVLGALLSAALLTAGCGDEPVSAPPDDEPVGVWLRGDLHLHSDHSNDARDNPMSAIRPLAESLGMDYFVVTDHDNHVNGVLTTWDDPDYRSDSMIMLYGVEWTTALGHANILSAHPWDHAPFWALREGEGEDIIAEARRQNVHFSINHPVAKDLWEFGFDMEFDSLEVWGALFAVPNNNRGAITLWDGLLRDGRRIAARGGSDCHHQEGVEAAIFNVGNPTTWVYAPERTAESLLEALRRGRASVGYAPQGERIELAADADGNGSFELMMGDNLAEPTGAPLRLRVRVVNARDEADYHVRLLRDGDLLIGETVVGADGLAELVWDDTPAEGGRTWYRAEVTGFLPLAPSGARFLYGDMVGLTNPIYVGFDDLPEL
mgnify:CR=1 FL=1